MKYFKRHFCVDSLYVRDGLPASKLALSERSGNAGQTPDGYAMRSAGDFSNAMPQFHIELIKVQKKGGGWISEQVACF
jgi:hypothetical protein